MRRIAVGLAAAVIAAGVGVAGKAEALPSYIALNSPSTTTLTNGPLTWYITSCSTGTTNVCGNLVMYADTYGTISIAAAPVSNAFQPLSSVYVNPTVTDLTLTIRAFSGATLGNGPNIISGAAENAVGVGAGGSASVTTVTHVAPFTASLGTVGLPGSGKPQTISFTPVNNVQYAMDIPLTATLTQVSVGTPIPEPAAFGLLAMSLLLTFGARAYRAR